MANQPTTTIMSKQLAPIMSKQLTPVKAAEVATAKQTVPNKPAPAPKSTGYVPQPSGNITINPNMPAVNPVNPGGKIMPAVNPVNPGGKIMPAVNPVNPGGKNIPVTALPTGIERLGAASAFGGNGKATDTLVTRAKGTVLGLQGKKL